MGIFARLKRVTLARIESFLVSVEDPELIFPRLVKEMEEQLGIATEAEAKAAAAVKRAERDVEQCRQKVDRMGNGAALALKEGDQDTAREAIVAQIDTEGNLERNQIILERSQEAYDNAKAAREQIQSQLQELKSKKDEIITRARVAKARQKIQQTVQGSATSSESILDAVARMEAAVEEAETELEIQNEITGGEAVETSLDKRLKELGREAEIEKRLDALRSQVEAGQAPGPDQD